MVKRSRREERGIASRPKNKLHARVELAAIFFEGERAENTAYRAGPRQVRFGDSTGGSESRSGLANEKGEGRDGFHVDHSTRK